MSKYPEASKVALHLAKGTGPGGIKDSSVDWFERLTGFKETSYDETRKRLVVEGEVLRSLVNGRGFAVGRLEGVSLQALRERVTSGDDLPGRLAVRNISGDVRQLHLTPEFTGALFQVASQFNLLEMVSPSVTPEQGVTRYQNDRTQGPACESPPERRRYTVTTLCRSTTERVKRPSGSWIAWRRFVWRWQLR
jgi:hypothetical protein